MYADPEVDAPLRREARIALQHAVLHLDGATHSVDYAAKLAVAGTLDYAPVMHRDSRIDQIAPERPKPRQRAIFVGRPVMCWKQYCGFSTQVRNGTCCRKAIRTTKLCIDAFKLGAATRFCVWF